MLKVADGLMNVSSGIEQVNTILNQFIFGRPGRNLDVEYINRNVNYTLDLINQYK